MVDTDTMLPELAQLQQLIDTAPPQLQVELLASIPHMAERLPLYGLALGNRSASAPAVVLVGGIHGLERIGTQVVLAYLQTLLNRLPWDLCLQHTLAHCCIYFIPLVNPAGMANGWRANGNSVDLMRNAPVECLEGAAWLVGGQLLHEGDTAAPGVVLETISCPYCRLTLVKYRWALI